MPQDKFKQPYQEQQQQSQHASPHESNAYPQHQSFSTIYGSQNPSSYYHTSSFQPVFQQRPNFSSCSTNNAVSSIPDNDNAYCTYDALLLAERWGINLRNVSPANPDYPISASDVQLYIDSFYLVSPERQQQGGPQPHKQNLKNQNTLSSNNHAYKSLKKRRKKHTNSGNGVITDEGVSSSFAPFTQSKMHQTQPEEKVHERIEHSVKQLAQPTKQGASSVHKETSDSPSSNTQSKLQRLQTKEKQVDKRIERNLERLAQTTQKVASSIKKETREVFSRNKQIAFENAKQRVVTPADELMTEVEREGKNVIHHFAEEAKEAFQGGVTIMGISKRSGNADRTNPLPSQRKIVNDGNE